jgi:hypothetical protein
MDCGGKRSATPLWEPPDVCESAVALRLPAHSKARRGGTPRPALPVISSRVA